jgi:IMP dehydrogenase/GMP reductase
MINYTKFDFDNILIVPHYITDITSRYKDIKLPLTLPLFTAPMDTVVNLDNMDEFTARGINVCLPRTLPFINELHINTELNNMTFPSFGIQDIDKLIKYEWLVKKYKNILIDVANGHMNIILNKCEKLKNINPHIKIMIGNIANPETYKYYATHKYINYNSKKYSETILVDYIRCGIGNGGGCITTKQSGVGYPMASLIAETREVKENLINEGYNNLPAIVADGGMKDYSDIVKAFALGADYVMLGSIFNKSLESCADNYYRGKKINNKKAEDLFFKGKKIEKYFRGMSTKSAQKAMGKTKFKTSEGVERFRTVKYTLESWLENFEHYLRNAMSYSDAKTLDEFIGKANIIRITEKAYNRFNK